MSEGGHVGISGSVTRVTNGGECKSVEEIRDNEDMLFYWICWLLISSVMMMDGRGG